MMSLHINNQHAKKRGIGKNLLLAVRTVMFQEQVDMVAGGFNGVSWRCSQAMNSDPLALSGRGGGGALPTHA